MIRIDRHSANKIEAVVTSYNQGTMILDAVHSLCSQTILPTKIIIVDDGSTEEQSLQVLETIESDAGIPVPVTIIRQINQGVSAARNTGIAHAQTPLVLVLDGDDRVEPLYIERVCQLLDDDPAMVAASSWMHTFGVLESVVRPGGGDIVPFLVRNCCPATHILRRDIWETSGGYDESMRSGFEDWDFFLRLLETASDTQIGIVPEALIAYRTAPASSNIKSMSKRLELIRYMIRRHKKSYQKYMEEAFIGLEALSMARLNGWETEITHVLSSKQNLSRESDDFLMSPSYGDGGMAAAVRIMSAVNSNKKHF